MAAFLYASSFVVRNWFPAQSVYFKKGRSHVQRSLVEGYGGSLHFGWPRLGPIGLRAARADDVPKSTNPSSPYRLVTAVNAAGDTWFAYRINKATGNAWNLPATGWSWNRMAESEQLPSGDYDLRILPTGSGNGAAATVLRIECKTGCTWVYSNGTWTPFTEPK